MWTQLPPEKGHTHPHPIFGLCLFWPNGWMDEDAALYGSRPRPRPHCTRRGRSSRERGTAAPPLFGPCLLWPRSPISATAELLFQWVVIIPQIDTIRAMVIVWRVRGKIIRSVRCNIVCNSCAQCNAHTWTDLTLLWIGFYLTGPISLCLDSFLYMHFVCHCILHVCVGW